MCQSLTRRLLLYHHLESNNSNRLVFNELVFIVPISTNTHLRLSRVVLI